MCLCVCHNKWAPERYHFYTPDLLQFPKLFSFFFNQNLFRIRNFLTLEMYFLIHFYFRKKVGYDQKFFFSNFHSIFYLFSKNSGNYRLLPQAEITLNLLCTSRVNTNLLAYAFLLGNYDFNKPPIPMALSGTRIVVHVKPAKQLAWGYHWDGGFYNGPAMERYRCVQCLMKTSSHIRVSDTVQFSACYHFSTNLTF